MFFIVIEYSKGFVIMKQLENVILKSFMNVLQNVTKKLTQSVFKLYSNN